MFTNGMCYYLEREYKKAAEMSKNMTAYNFSNDKIVYIQHEDGSEFKWRYAFVQKVTNTNKENEYEPDWFLYVFTEHHGFHVYGNSEILNWYEAELQYGACDE